jgi:amino acid transporter
VEFRILTYLVTCAALAVLRRRAGEIMAGFRVPAGDLVAVMSIVTCVALILSRPLGELKQLAIAVGLGGVGYLVLSRRRVAANWEP